MFIKFGQACLVWRGWNKDSNTFVWLWSSHFDLTNLLLTSSSAQISHSSQSNSITFHLHKVLKYGSSHARSLLLVREARAVYGSVWRKGVPILDIWRRYIASTVGMFSIDLTIKEKKERSNNITLKSKTVSVVSTFKKLLTSSWRGLPYLVQDPIKAFPLSSFWVQLRPPLLLSDRGLHDSITSWLPSLLELSCCSSSSVPLDLNSEPSPQALG